MVKIKLKHAKQLIELAKTLLKKGKLQAMEKNMNLLFAYEDQIDDHLKPILAWAVLFGPKNSKDFLKKCKHLGYHEEDVGIVADIIELDAEEFFELYQRHENRALKLIYDSITKLP